MIQNQKNKIDNADASVEIPMSIGSVVKRNCGFMKKWSDKEISEIFKKNGNLRSYYPAHFSPHVYLVKRTRELAVLCLQLLFEENVYSGFRPPTKAECTKLAHEIISEENIRNKFNQSIIIDVRLRPYTSTALNSSAVLTVVFDFPF